MRFRFFALALCVFLSSQISSSAAVPPSAAPPSTQKVEQLKFTKIFEDSARIIEIENDSFSSILDEEEDLLVGAILKMTIKNPSDDASSYVNAVVAVCGHQGLIIVRSKLFDKDGKFLKEVTEPLILSNLKEDSVSGMMYTFMCTTAPKPTPVAPGYKAPTRYNQFWS